MDSLENKNNVKSVTHCCSSSTTILKQFNLPVAQTCALTFPQILQLCQLHLLRIDSHVPHLKNQTTFLQKKPSKLYENLLRRPSVFWFRKQ